MGISINKKMILRNWVLILLLMMVGFSLVCIGIIISGNRLTDDTIKTFYDYNIKEKKNSLTIEVNNTLDEIEYDKNVLIGEKKEQLEEQVISIVQWIEREDSPLIDSKEKLEWVRFLAPFFIEESDNFFIYDSEGVEYVVLDDLKIEKKNTLDNRTLEILRSSMLDKGCFFEYNTDGRDATKMLAFALYIEKIDLIIGVETDYNALILEIQENVYNRLQAFYENKENYIFVNAYDSTAKVAGKREEVGTKISSLTDYNGEVVHEQMMAVIEEYGEGFVQYQFQNRDNSQAMEKLSFIKDFKEWGVYVGIGFYIDDLKQELIYFDEQYKTYFYNQALFIIVGLILLALMIFAMIQRGVYMQRKFLEQSDVVYEKLFNYTRQGVLVISDKGELIYQNIQISEMFQVSIEPYIIAGNLAFPTVSDMIYQVYLNNKTLYIRYKKEVVNFKGIDSSIYFLEDITKEYLETHRIEKMAYLDALTKLPNRHALIEDYQLLQFSPDDTHYVIGIIDIDHFKKVNDTYGHNIGDEVLKILAQVFMSRLRETDKIYRYGGEEFVVVLKQLDLKKAKKIIEELIVSFSNEVNSIYEFSCTFSCGLVDFETKKAKSLNSYIEEADRLLYEAKNQGRNCVKIKT